MIKKFVIFAVFGQILYINPVKQVIVMQAAAWPQADTDARWREADAVIDAIVATL